MDRHVQADAMTADGATSRNLLVAQRGSIANAARNALREVGFADTLARRELDVAGRKHPMNGLARRSMPTSMHFFDKGQMQPAVDLARVVR